VHVGESPAADEQIDHARGGGAGSIRKVRSGFDDDPGVGSTVGGHCIAGFYDGTGQCLMLVQAKSQGHVERAFDAVDAHFAVALGGVSVAATEERAGIVDGQIEF